jgi:hypothetical protein
MNPCTVHTQLSVELLRLHQGATAGVLHAACPAQVEELLQTKPAPASMDDSSSVVSGGGSSKLDMFTRKFKNTMVELINADLSQPISSQSQSHGHSPLQLTPRQQQPEQQPSRSSTPVPTGQPQQQQQQQSPAAQPTSQQHAAAVSSSTSSPAAPASREGVQAGNPSGSLQPGETWCLRQHINRGCCDGASLATVADGSTTLSAFAQVHACCLVPAHTCHCCVCVVCVPAGVHAAFLKQCVSAIDSLALLAGALKAAKPGLLALLKAASLSKEVDSHFSRSVDAAADLRDVIYLGAAKQLLPVSLPHTVCLCVARGGGLRRVQRSS